MKKVVVIEPGYLHYQEEERVLKAHNAHFTALPIGTDKAVVMKEIADADAVMVREALVDAEMIEVMAKCKVIVRYGVGVDNIDLKAAKAKGIYVANVPDYGSEDVAEHAVALMLAATRRIPTRDADVRQGKWGMGQSEPMFRLGGKVLGVVGFGRIARSFAEKASGLGFKSVLVSDPALTPEQAKEAGVVSVSLETLCQEADFISLHAPLNQHTRHMINADVLATMKPSAILVNTGRGGLVDETALYHALKENQIFAAGIDVFEQEPVAHDHPLLSLPNAICTDHTAWFTEESVIELQHKGAKEVLRVFDGQAPQNWVNR
ncbi:C-terminal binding protein [Photobacterium rosenbergii]|uniref:C-terminal binding protein n=1 Tax=Photobacterium rosenbergii TaxID=294936 RepID=A0A2T3N6G7_9GAMM|nr:C-terminal binding protein [Photobacterium rosenbergii]PSW08291.1 C-terminal binding protein [Photobacterium rosenbergii]